MICVPQGVGWEPGPSFLFVTLRTKIATDFGDKQRSMGAPPASPDAAALNPRCNSSEWPGRELHVVQKSRHGAHAQGPRIPGLLRPGVLN
jgi:hypothetical protein